MRELLQNLNFRRLWFAQICLALGDSVMQMGLLEFFRLHGYNERIEAAKLFFSVSLPGAVLGPVAIAWLDKWQRRQVLVTCDALRACSVVVLIVWLQPILADRVEPRNLHALYAVLFLIGALTAFHYPARYALLPNLVKAEELIPANTLFVTTITVANVGGRALGGVVAEKIGVQWAVLANVLAYVVSLALVWRIQMAPHATTGGENAHREGSWGELKTGMIYLWRHPTAVPLVVLTAVVFFLLAVFLVAIVGFTMDTLGLHTSGVGYLIGAAGAGAAIGIFVVGRGKPWTRTPWLPFTQLLIVGILLVLLGSTTNVALVAVLLFFLGGFGATMTIPIDAKLQEQIEDHRRGAVFAARGALTAVTMVIGFWLQFGTEFFREMSPPTILLWLGVGSAITALLMLCSVRRGPPSR